MAMQAWAFMSHQSGWCGINPVNGLLYSHAKTAGGQIVLYTYDPETLQRVGGRFPLRTPNGGPFSPNVLQGGAFSSNGHLYVVTSPGQNNRLYWFDMLTGVEAGMFPVHEYIHEGDELEGMVLIDLDDVEAPCDRADGPCSGGRLRGQLHILQNLGGEYSFVHIGVAPSERARI